MIKVESFPIGNYTVGRNNKKIKYGVIHFVSAKNWKHYKNDPYNVEGILDMLKYNGKKHSYSWHFLVGRNGRIVQSVDIKNTAWHAGKSVIAMPEYIRNINDISVGIEFVGDGKTEFTDEQYKKGGELAAYIEKFIHLTNLGMIKFWVGHSFISGILAVKLGIKKRKKMKRDPGRNFNWSKFLKEKYKVQLKDELKNDLKKEIQIDTLNDIPISQLMKILTKRIFKKS